MENNNLIYARYCRVNSAVAINDLDIYSKSGSAAIREGYSIFSLRNFLDRNNGELLNNYTQLVDRTFLYLQGNLGGTIPKGDINTILKENIVNLFKDISDKIEHGKLEEALVVILELIKYGNRYYDINVTDKIIKADKAACDYVILHCIHIVANIAVLLYPFLPFSLCKIFEALSLKLEWKPQYISENHLTEFKSLHTMKLI